MTTNTTSLTAQIKAAEAERETAARRVRELRAEQKWIEKNSDRVDAAILALMIDARADIRQWAERERPDVIARLRDADRTRTNAARQSLSPEGASDDSDESGAQSPDEADTSAP